MNITFFGTYDTATTPRVQVLIDGLRAHGARVTECNVPLRVSTAVRVAILRQPWRLPVLVLQIVKCWAQLIGKSRRLITPDVVVVGHLGQFDVHLARLLFRRTPIALDYMVSGTEAAEDRRIGSTLKYRLLTWLDNSALAHSDIVIVDTEEHRRDLPSQHRNKGVVVMVGAPEIWFKAGEKECGRKVVKPIRIGFFGNYVPLQGAPVIAEAAKYLKNPSVITMVGPKDGQDFARARRAASGAKRARIEWVDHWVPADELPFIMAKQDICLGVFGTNKKSYKVVPNKVYQCAAAGCAIVTSDTPSQRRVLGPAGAYTPPGDARALARLLDGLAGKPDLVRRMRAATFKLAKDTFTAKSVVAPLYEVLLSLCAARS